MQPFSALTVALVAVTSFAQSRPRTTLDVYLVDVEGGNATLFVSPAGESLLIDTGNGGAAATRDADRIMAAAMDAGITRIDHLVTTHYHGDHFGGMAELTGANSGPQLHRSRSERGAERGTEAFLQKVYPDALRKGHTHGREARRSDCDERARRADSDRRRTGDSSAAARRRTAEPAVCGFQAAGAGRDGERAVSRHAHHLRTFPGRCTSAT